MIFKGFLKGSKLIQNEQNFKISNCFAILNNTESVMSDNFNPKFIGSKFIVQKYFDKEAVL